MVANRSHARLHDDRVVDDDGEGKQAASTLVIAALEGQQVSVLGESSSLWNHHSQNEDLQQQQNSCVNTTASKTGHYVERAGISHES